MDVTIYHNPHCSKSRHTLELLEERGIEPRVVRYLDAPPSVEALDRILRLLDKEPREVMRRREAPYRELDLDDPELTRNELLEAMVEHPILIQRPLVVVRDGAGGSAEDGDAVRAALGRPPESVLEIL